MKNLSPSLTIYKFPISAISSITNRLTGAYLSKIFVFGGVISLLDYNKHVYKYYNDMNSDRTGAYFTKLFNYVTIFSLVYHSIGGVRHIVWDKFPGLLTTKSVNMQSKLMFFVSVPLTFMCEKLI